MKTLKKTLCLVLAVVMVVGVLILPASAATYEDDAKITHKEAVEVLTALKILTGDAEGFRPGDTLSRAEAATVITKLLQTPAIAARYPAGKTGFADVDGDKTVDWASGFIAFAASQGIINGTEKGFEPNDNVTGTEFAKMLLCALGYDAVTEGYIGNLWDVNVISRALTVKLDDGIEDFEYDEDLTRDNMAQMAYNALNATMVGYDNLGKLADRTGADNKPLTLNSQNGYDVEEAEVGHNEIGVPETYVVTVGDKAVYTTYATAVKTYNTAKTFGDILKDIKGDKATPADMPAKYFVDGVPSYYSNSTPFGSEYKAQPFTNDKGSSACAIGSTTTVYTVKEIPEGGTAKTDVYYIVRVNDKYKPVVTEGATANYKDGVLTLEGSGTTALTVKIEAKKGDIVVYNTGKNAKDETVVVGKPYVATVLNGTITGKGTDVDTNTYIRINGDTSKIYKAVATPVKDTLDIVELNVSADTKYNFYLDNNGNIINVAAEKAPETTSVVKYTYLLSYKEQEHEDAVDAKTDIFGNVTAGSPEKPAMAVAVVMDLATGKVSSVNLPLYSVADATGVKYYLADKDGHQANTNEIGSNKNTFEAGFYKYEENAAGEMVLGEAVTSQTVSDYTKGALTMTIGGTALYLSETTKLTVFTHTSGTDADHLDDKFTPTQYTGYTQFPALTGTNVDKAIVLTDSKNEKMATDIYVILKGTSASDEKTLEPTDLAIFVGQGEQTLTGTSFSFIVGGKVETYVADNTDAAAITTAVSAGTSNLGQVYKLTLKDGKLKSVATVACTNKNKVISFATASYILFKNAEGEDEADPVKVGSPCVVVDAHKAGVWPTVGALPTDLTKNKVTVSYYTEKVNGVDYITLIVITGLEEIKD